MAKYVVLQHPEKQLPKVVKSGFSWPGFFLPYLWFIIKLVELQSTARLTSRSADSRLPRMALPTGLFLGFVMILGLQFVGDGLIEIRLLILFSTACATGMYGNAWMTEELHARSWETVLECDAPSAYAALQQVKDS